jgi:uroporphyrinogen-III decarboxylase
VLHPKENFLETIKRNGHPDRLVNQLECIELFTADPVAGYVRGARYRGMPPTKDKWGTTFIWPESQYAVMPHITPETKVIRDITRWREFVRIPDITANCSAPEAWEKALEAAAKIDRSEKFLMAFMPTGIFEQIHYLMGFEDALASFLLEPEAMADLCLAIGEYRYNYMKLLADNLKPDIMFSHDDWGSKTSLFMSPETWRKFIKPKYIDIYGYLKQRGIIVIHHADSFLEPIVEDMADLGIDVWQGVLPQNDIPALQKLLKGRMVLMGGIDSAIVDREDATEEVIRKEVRRACETYGPGGAYIPGITNLNGIYPHVDPIVFDEVQRYNREVYGYSDTGTSG